MTTDELLDKFNSEFGLYTWPEVYEVDIETYKNVLLTIYEQRSKYRHLSVVSISLGRTGKLLYKNVELTYDKGEGTYFK